VSDPRPVVLVVEDEPQMRRLLRASLGAFATGARAVLVRAPEAGVVLRILRESGGPVAAGAPLVEIGDTSRIEVVVDLPSADAVRTSRGAAALVTGWGGAGPLQAVVGRVEPSAYTKVSPLGVEEQRVDLVLEPRGAGWGALGDGYAVDAAITVRELGDAVRVPASALFRRGDGWAVFAVEDGRARSRPVEVDGLSGGAAAIARGLAPGDAVVLHPGDRVAEGVRLRRE